MIGYYTYLPGKTVVALNLSRPCHIPNAPPFNVAVSSVPCTGQAFACKCHWSQYGVVCCTISLGHVVPSLVCNRVAPIPAPGTSVSNYRDLVSS